MQLNPDWKQLYTDKAYTSVIQDGDVFMIGRPDPNLALGYRTLAISKSDLVSQLGAGSIATVKVTIQPNQIKTLFSIPILAVSAPGVGYALTTIGFDIRYNYVSGGWSTNGSNIIITSDPLSSSSVLTYQMINVTILDFVTKNTFLLGYNDANEADTNTVVENAPLYIKLDTADSSTLGTGTLDCYITYQILKL